MKLNQSTASLSALEVAMAIILAARTAELNDGFKDIEKELIIYRQLNIPQCFYLRGASA